MSRPPRAVRIGMWSGPRNLSTALMRSWGSRDDTFVCDEPLYAHYLLRTGVEHPGRAEVMARHETEWRKAVAWLTGPVPEGRHIFYQKQMAHHLLPEIDRGWLRELRNVLLIRDPEEMLTSLIKVTPKPTIEDTGLPQQWELFASLREVGEEPPVIDARDVLEDPPGMLRALCRAVGVPFSTAMLSWEPGPRTTDGVWAKHWYAAVERSTSFAPYRPKAESVPERLRRLYEDCATVYRRLHAHRLRPAAGGE